MKAVLLSLLFVVVCAGPVRAQSLEDRLESARVVARAKIALAQDAALRAFIFQPSVRGDVLTLDGNVETPAQRSRAAEVVRGLEGVATVVNNVRVSSAPGATRPDLPPAPEVAEPEAAEAEAEAAPEPPPEEVYHTVQRGDVLGSIARRYGVSVRQIQQLNGLRGTNIRVGQRLRVK